MQNAKLSIAVANAIFERYREQLLELYDDHIAFAKLTKDLAALVIGFIEDEEVSEVTKYIQDSLNKDMIYQLLSADTENEKIAAQGDKVNGWKEGE